MQCAKCGNDLAPGVTRCGQCGTAVEPQQYGGPQYGQPQYGQPYSQPAARPYQYGPGPTDPGIGFSVTGIVLGAISFLFCPLVLGIAAIIFAGVAKSRGERLANVALAVSIAGLVVGLVLGFIVFSSFSTLN